jgi:hypothetical protein
MVETIWGLNSFVQSRFGTGCPVNSSHFIWFPCQRREELLEMPDDDEWREREDDGRPAGVYYWLLTCSESCAEMPDKTTSLARFGFYGFLWSFMVFTQKPGVLWLFMTFMEFPKKPQVWAPQVVPGITKDKNVHFLGLLLCICPHFLSQHASRISGACVKDFRRTLSPLIQLTC